MCHCTILFKNSYNSNSLKLFISDLLGWQGYPKVTLKVRTLICTCSENYTKTSPQPCRITAVRMTTTFLGRTTSLIIFWQDHIVDNLAFFYNYPTWNKRCHVVVIWKWNCTKYSWRNTNHMTNSTNCEWVSTNSILFGGQHDIKQSKGTCK